jgi:hypothetical protein
MDDVFLGDHPMNWSLRAPLHEERIHAAAVIAHDHAAPAWRQRHISWSDGPPQQRREQPVQQQQKILRYSYWRAAEHQADPQQPTSGTNGKNGNRSAGFSHICGGLLITQTLASFFRFYYELRQLVWLARV